MVDDRCFIFKEHRRIRLYCRSEQDVYRIFTRVRRARKRMRVPCMCSKYPFLFSFLSEVPHLWAGAGRQTLRRPEEKNSKYALSIRTRRFRDAPVLLSGFSVFRSLIERRVSSTKSVSRRGPARARARKISRANVRRLAVRARRAHPYTGVIHCRYLYHSVIVIINKYRSAAVNRDVFLSLAPESSASAVATFVEYPFEKSSKRR